MNTAVSNASANVRRLELPAIQSRLAACPRLPSLRSIDSALRELLNADQRYTQQIAEVIRRDPSLTARLLRLVNSVYYGLSTPVNNLEEAVLYLGLRQIRQLVMVTPILEDFQRLTGQVRFSWGEFWQHCIGTAILSREVMASLQTPSDETDYVAGLVHDMGKIVMAWAFPDHFLAIYQEGDHQAENLLEIEDQVLGINHAELGALYLKNYNLPNALVDTARYHHTPERAGENAPIVAAVQIADLLMRLAHIGKSGSPGEITETIWTNASGWGILFPQGEPEKSIAQAGLKRSLERLPMLLEGLI
jgi:putative nucleotidyltransferase with HDIG domain